MGRLRSEQSRQEQMSSHAGDGADNLNVNRLAQAAEVLRIKAWTGEYFESIGNISQSFSDDKYQGEFHLLHPLRFIGTGWRWAERCRRSAE